jgi:predicted aldo/keto reductase-like oxidoreductase
MLINMERRNFLKKTVLSAGALSITGLSAASGGTDKYSLSVSSSDSPPASTPPGRLPRRPYGKTGIDLSIIAFGGILVMNVEQDRANRLVAEAVEKGVNYFDVAPTYGNAIRQLGPALAPYRKDVFLACKTTERTASGAEKELKESLAGMKTDHFDLYQLHALTDLKKDVDAVFAPGGAMETFLAAKKDGRVRHLGFSAHSEEAAIAALGRYDFDSILFPFNFACWLKGGFGPKVMEKAQAKGAARLALKALARQKWPNETDRKAWPKCWYQPLTDPHETSLALRYTLSLPVTAAVPPGEEPLWRLALDTALDLKPLTDSDRADLKSLADSLKPIFTA